MGMYLMLQVGVLLCSRQALEKGFHSSRGASSISTARREHDRHSQAMRVAHCVHIAQTLPEIFVWNTIINRLEDTISCSIQVGARKICEERQISADAPHLFRPKDGSTKERTAAALAGSKQGKPIRQHFGLRLSPSNGQQTIGEPIFISARASSRSGWENSPVTVWQGQFLNNFFRCDIA